MMSNQRLYNTIDVLSGDILPPEHLPSSSSETGSRKVLVVFESDANAFLLYDIFVIQEAEWEKLVEQSHAKVEFVVRSQKDKGSGDIVEEKVTMGLERLLECVKVIRDRELLVAFETLYGRASPIAPACTVNLLYHLQGVMN